MLLKGAQEHVAFTTIGCTAARLLSGTAGRSTTVAPASRGVAPVAAAIRRISGPVLTRPATAAATGPAAHRLVAQKDLLAGLEGRQDLVGELLSQALLVRSSAWVVARS